MAPSGRVQLRGVVSGVARGVVAAPIRGRRDFGGCPERGRVTAARSFSSLTADVARRSSASLDEEGE
jgi:hypothetical protein